jgi:hypothetical protein
MNKAQCYCVIALLNMALVSPATAESVYLFRDGISAQRKKARDRQFQIKC